MTGCEVYTMKHSSQPYEFAPGICLPDSLGITFNPNITSNGLMEVTPGQSYKEWLKKVDSYFEGGYYTIASEAREKYMKSHASLINKLKKNERSDFSYYYLGVKSITITANVKIGDVESGEDISSLFSIHSSINHRRVFTYPNCNLAFDDPDYLPKSIQEFCSVTPLYIDDLVLSPDFEMTEEEKESAVFTVTFVVEDEFMGERQLNGISKHGNLSTHIQ